MGNWDSPVVLELSPTNGIEAKCVLSPLAGNDDEKSTLSTFDSVLTAGDSGALGKESLQQSPNPGSDGESFIPDSFDDLSGDDWAIPGTPRDDM